MIEFFDDFFTSLEGGHGLTSELVAITTLVIVINVIMKWALLKLHARYKMQGNLWKDCLIVALVKPLTTLVWFIAAIQAIKYFWQRFGQEAIPFSSHTLIVSGAIFCFAWFLLRWKKLVVHRLLEKSKAGLILLDHGKVDAMNKVGTIAIYLITGLLLLEQFGSSLNTLIAFGGVSGLAIAFASQQIISNFFGGIVIYFTQPFVVGDWIQLPEKDIEGYVEEIGWYTTRVRTFDKRPIYIPNSMLSNILVSNPSRMTHRQFKQTFSLRNSDIALIPAIVADLRKFFQSHPKIDQHLNPQIHLGAVGPAGLDINITAYTTTVEKASYNDLVQDLLYGITSIILKNGADFTVSSHTIEFPKGIPSPRENDPLTPS
jgi:MscS family membrane protein